MTNESIDELKQTSGVRLMRTKWNLTSVNWSGAWIRWNLICAQIDQQSKWSFIVGERWWWWTGVKWSELVVWKLFIWTSSGLLTDCWWFSSLPVDIFCWFDDPRSRLFATFRTNMCMLEIKPEIKNRIMTHDRAIVAARYLAKQKQVEFDTDDEESIESSLLYRWWLFAKRAMWVSGRWKDKRRNDSMIKMQVNRSTPLAWALMSWVRSSTPEEATEKFEYVSHWTLTKDRMGERGCRFGIIMVEFYICWMLEKVRRWKSHKLRHWNDVLSQWDGASENSERWITFIRREQSF